AGGDVLADRRRTRERNHVDEVGTGEHVTDGSGILRRDDVEHTRRNVGFLGNELAYPRRAERRVGRGLEDRGAAGGQRGRELREVEHEREVPRRDESGHTHRLAHDQAIRRHAEELVLAEFLFPGELVDLVDVRLHVLDAAVLLYRERESDRRADFGDDLRAQFFLVLVERFLQLQQARL